MCVRARACVRACVRVLLITQLYDNLLLSTIKFPDTASRKERADFLIEIEVMKRISEGFNPHIVNMVGCVTIQEPLCLITEFVPHGDLLDYLRKQRKKVSKERCQYTPMHVGNSGIITRKYHMIDS